MKLKFFALSLFLISAALNSTVAQQVFKTTETSVIGFLEYLPAGYNSNSDKYPVVIFLHGIGERGPNSTDPSVLDDGAPLLVKHGPPKHVNNGTEFPFILISPQLKSNYGDWPSWYVMEVIQHVKTYLRIDERRVYLTGLSLGGGGTWTTVQDYTTEFAATAPVCGNRNSTSKACLLAAENLPVWAFHGDIDTVVPLSKSVSMINAINACVPAPSPLAQLTIYTGVAHNAWDRAYKPDHTYHNPNVYEWMLSFMNMKNGSNTIPIADAGNDQVTSSTSVTLTGTGSDPDGSVATYSWSQVSGPAPATWTNNSSASVNVNGLVPGSYLFKLQVTDQNGGHDTDYVTVTVGTAVENASPIASAGADKLISTPTSSTKFYGSGSDSDGTVTSYQWIKTSGPAATLSGATTATLTASSLTPGIYTFRLTVTDDEGASSSDDVTLTVNIAPVANAGPDKTIIWPTSTITLNGTGTDGDGTINTFKWTKTSGAAASLSGSTTPTLLASNLAQGSYVFRLTVTDNNGVSKFDEVNVVVNTPPTAVAGADQTITLPATTTSLSGSGADADGTIDSYQWTKISGAAVTMAGASTPTLSVSGLAVGSYTFSLTVTDNQGGSGSDDVTINVVSATNIPPVANAGADRLVRLPISYYNVSGSGADDDGSIVSYSWSQISGPVCSLSNQDTDRLKITSPVTGICVFKLEVTDDKGAKASDDVTIKFDFPPVANAGADVSITLPNNTISLTGSGTDPDGSVTYLWSKYSGPNATLTDKTAATVLVSNLQEGTYVFKLAVTDDMGATDIDYATILVSAAAATSTSTAGRTSTSAETELLTTGPSETETMAAEKISTAYQRGVSFLNQSSEALKNCTLVIFNEMGERIFSGPWKSELFDKVFSEKTIYIFNVIQNGKTIDSGKLMIKEF
ncbi:MAG: PKD domain-containing protein [Bacteroidota bacterium]